ncbi:MAG: amino acid--tRNA ligase-related protein [Dehalococcoidia bacterium]|nr:amino acid--tRNA ligase-related protein [Dehalococcoidia bacterium]
MEDALLAQRLAKLEELRDHGIDPDPHRTARSHTTAEVTAIVEAHEESEPDVDPVDVAGRVVAHRDMGKAAFLDVQDGSGRIQVLMRKNVLGEEDFDLLRLIDLGDFIGVQGKPMRTRTGQPTIGAQSWTVLAKALHAPPEKYHGLHDAEQRQRRRYLDLMSNDETRRVFAVRSRVVSGIRRFLDDRGFLEVETPVLQENAGGAAARPFVTHFNALDEDRFLRISLELHLKRLVVGGFDRVYELGRIFRNEGLGAKYNPEFTMLESYQAYADYNDVATMVEEMISTVARDALGSLTCTFRDNDDRPYPALATHHVPRRPAPVRRSRPGPVPRCGFAPR